MDGLLGFDFDVTRQMLVALAFGAATLVLFIRGATTRLRSARVELRGRPPGSAAAVAALEAVCRRGDISDEHQSAQPY